MEITVADGRAVHSETEPLMTTARIAANAQAAAEVFSVTD
jgi:hypothetical protein